MPTRVFSTEDGNLANSALVTSRNRVFSDIDLTFEARPSGDIYKKTDAAAVKQAVKNLVLTNHFEKPFNPTFGGDVISMLFELADPNVDQEIYNNIITTIEKYEPRATILDIQVDPQPDLNSISVTVEFQIVNSDQIVTFSNVLSRLR